MCAYAFAHTHTHTHTELTQGTASLLLAYQSARHARSCTHTHTHTHTHRINPGDRTPPAGYQVSKARRELLCSICRQPCGAPIQCAAAQCRTAFHPLCARNAGLPMVASSEVCVVWGWTVGCEEVHNTMCACSAGCPWRPPVS